MLFFKSLAPLAALLSVAVASPIESRQSATTCGSTAYSAAQVRAAANAACNYYRAGDTAGSSTYPHTFNNREGFDFLVSGPYQEFPIKSSGVYTGGSPGADRVVINTSCQYAGAITHTGASGNNFVGCSGTN
ncbi:Guanyl-specific ribonuclease F1 [Fusarium euwallaceae]|uniref:ribonuclease T1 n=4 Tax=Fusarium solani species complex TaxID=232080 RepID=A0A3M2RN17_9HYPO|nr:Guanyl-specific ribonuclease F1 [Fusarium kuroshium]RSL89604.1 Guanyl-specific ribonuclease F1 [Fusarium floridanum]RSM16165.1 Guanyl-specific ribonuclease F1 [Fusarium ambrosium]RTE84032.1 Guanyl-specific ribonuclease F1 [Fusarium euwallaceae]